MLYLILSALLLTVAILVGTAASRHADAAAIAILSSAMAIVIPFIVLVPKLVAKHSFAGQGFGLAMGALSGLFIGVYVLTLTKSLAETKVGIVAPVVYGGAIVLSTVLSYIIYKEKLTLLEGVGLGLVVAGLALVMYARAHA